MRRRGTVGIAQASPGQVRYGRSDTASSVWQGVSWPGWAGRGAARNGSAGAAQLGLAWLGSAAHGKPRQECHGAVGCVVVRPGSAGTARHAPVGHGSLRSGWAPRGVARRDLVWQAR